MTYLVYALLWLICGVAGFTFGYAVDDDPLEEGDVGLVLLGPILLMLVCLYWILVMLKLILNKGL